MMTVGTDSGGCLVNGVSETAPLNREIRRRTDVVGIFLRDRLFLGSPEVTRHLLSGRQALTLLGSRSPLNFGGGPGDR